MVQAVIGQFEQMVLTAILALGDRAYGVTIHGEVGSLAGKPISLGSIYATLDRLEDKGLIESWLSNPTPERGGRSKRHYRLLAAGSRVLRESVQASRRVCEAVDAVWGGLGGRRLKPARQTS
ncbi:Transcriptional regulator PadR-like family protein [compost metagenome]